ncbi:MAG: T9SS type A sorting domain-containing protein [Bacteroidota bacterium]
MKKLLVMITMMLMSICGFGQTNVYHPFPDTGARWGGNNWWNNQYCQCIVTDEHTLFMDGDTIIGSFHYQKLLQSGYKTAYLYPYWCCAYVNTYKGAIRQDTLQKKIYINVGNQDTLLYDFNLSLGDTLSFVAYNSNQDTNIVTNIDSIQIENNYRKRFNISVLHRHNNLLDSNYVSLIEGIGSTYGLLDPITPYFESGSSLECFSLNSQTLYPDTSTFCNINVGIPSINLENGIILLSPNPFSTQATLTFQGIKNENNKSLFVYNLLGQDVQNIFVGNNNEVIIHRNNLPSGMYFYKLMDDNKTVLGMGKMMVE